MHNLVTIVQQILNDKASAYNAQLCGKQHLKTNPGVETLLIKNVTTGGKSADFRLKQLDLEETVPCSKTQYLHAI